MKEILIAGDLLPTPSNYKLFENMKVDDLLGEELLKIFNDEGLYKIINLEGPLTDSNNEIKKSGPVLKGTELSVKGIKKMGINLCSLANNHILDYGLEGLHSTIKLLNENEISYVGAGNTIKDAGLPFIISFDDIRVGVYSCAEYEFTIATEQHGGANPFDSLEIAEYIENIKLQVDYLIVLYHGGKEHYRYPAPYVQRRCRKMIEKGADLVICQHSHCVGCMEEYKEGTIVYGQGNFIFDRGDNEFRNTGLLIKVNPNIREIQYIPIVKQGNGVRLADSYEGQNIIGKFMERSEEIREVGIVEKKYEQFAIKMLQSYDLWCLGFIGRVLKKLRLRKLSRWLFSNMDELAILNYLRCEAHRDLFVQGIKNRLHI